MKKRWFSIGIIAVLALLPVLIFFIASEIRSESNDYSFRHAKLASSFLKGIKGN